MREFYRNLRMAVRLARRLRRDEEGATLIEFLVAFPVMLIFILLVMDVGLGVQTYSTLNHAANDTARFISARGCDNFVPITSPEIQDFVNRQLTGVVETNGTGPTVSVTFTAPPSYDPSVHSCPLLSGVRFTVTIVHQHRFILAYMFGLPAQTFRGQASIVVI